MIHKTHDNAVDNQNVDNDLFDDDEQVEEVLQALNQDGLSSQGGLMTIILLSMTP